MNFTQWLKNHSNLAHSLVAAWGVATTLFATSPAFRAYVMKLYGETGPKVHEVIAGVAIPLLIYWQSQKKTVVTAEVSPGQTAAVIGAAKVETKPEEESK